MHKIESIQDLLNNIEKGNVVYFTMFDNKRSTKSIDFKDSSKSSLIMIHNSSGRRESIDLVDWEQSSLLTYIDMKLYME